MAQDFNANVNTNTYYYTLDYSDHFNLLNDFAERIAIALENLSANIADIKVDIARLANSSESIDTSLQNIDISEGIIADGITTIASTVINIDAANTIDGIGGPHMRSIGTGYYRANVIDSPTNIARGMMVLNLKATNKLDDLKEELINPTPLVD